MPCILFGHPLELWYRVANSFDFDYTDAEINAMVTSGRGIDSTLFPESSNRTVNIEATFGGITRDPTTNAVTGAKAIQMTYLLGEHPDGSDERNAAIAWEDQLNYLIGDAWTDPDLSQGSATRGDVAWTSTLIDIFPQTAGARARELGKNIRGDLAALNGGFFIILLYAVFIFGRFTPVRSRVLLAISGCASVGFAIAFAFGFTTLLGFKLNPVINVLPFVLIGIGVDDMFV